MGRYLGERRPPAAASSATIRSAVRPEMVSVSGPVAATVAPASASTVIAAVRAPVRRVTRSPDAAAISSATRRRR